MEFTLALEFTFSSQLYYLYSSTKSWRIDIYFVQSGLITESVNRVLEYIRVAKITDAKELDTLLCHCQNKLAGNIDGTELKLSRSGDNEE